LRPWHPAEAEVGGQESQERLLQLLTEREMCARFAALDATGGETLADRREGPRVVVGGNFGTPRRLLELFDASLARYRLFMINAQSPVPDRSGVIHETPFVGPGMRPTKESSSRLDYLPMRLSLVPQLFERFRSPDVVLVQTTPPSNGRLSLGIEVNVLVAAIEVARRRGGLVVAQLNPRMPRTLGDAEMDLELFDAAIEAEEPLASPPSCVLSDTARAIGGNVASLVEDGSTLQLGIGSIPDASVAALGRRRRLGVWSEMVSDGVLGLEEIGALDAGRPITTSFLFGSAELYAWVNRNPRLQLLRTEKTNDPGRIACQPSMTSINTALQVDLYAQANATYVGNRVYSGLGGQTDFIVGALHAPGGHAVIALPSWHEKSQSSTVLAQLASPVTSFQHSAIATEHGVAEIFGRSQHAQARAIIENAAHPSARDGLWEAAAKLHLA
jgi:acyl-CoA hydrolase